VSARAVRYLVDGYLERLGLKAKGISCHSLRHSAATWARTGGAKLDALADMMGHADVSTTRIYAQIVDKMTENPARFLEAMLTA
jgi:site-specific recombinase XerD